MLDERLAAIDAKAKAGMLPDVTIDKGVLKITPITKSTPPEAEALARASTPCCRACASPTCWPRWRLDGFTDCFTHLRTGETAADRRVLMAGLLADGLNLGLTRMAEACRVASLGQLAWTADWHIRDETYALALRCLVDQQQREPLAASSAAARPRPRTASSSRPPASAAPPAPQRPLRPRAGDQVLHPPFRPLRAVPHQGDRRRPPAKPCTCSTRCSTIRADMTRSTRHHTDGGGVSDHVFALVHLLGFRFAPRIPDLKDRRSTASTSRRPYPSLEPLIAGRINVALIRAHWDDILRIAVSIRNGLVTASVILRQLAAFPRQNGVAAALRELGRLERTLFTLDWL